MQHKCDLGSDRIKVFFSSSMANARYMEQRLSVRSFFERMKPLYHWYFIEEHASPNPVKKEYTEEVVNSDIVIVVLQSNLRAGVQKEYETAQRAGKRIFCFEHSGRKTQSLKNFIGKVRLSITTTKFDDTRDLIDKIEHNLLSDLVKEYVRLYEENKRLREAVSGPSSSESITMPDLER